VETRFERAEDLNIIPFWFSQTVVKPKKNSVGPPHFVFHDWNTKKEERMKYIISVAAVLLAIVVSAHEADFVGYTEAGIASMYDEPQEVACGGHLDPEAMTAAHKTLPCGSVVRVTNTSNGKTVDVEINDRGPYVQGLIIDLSRGAFRKIGNTSAGLIHVKIERIK
jgi:rare lipoprotein A